MTAPCQPPPGVSTAVRERMLPCGDLEKAEYLVSSIRACLLAASQDLA
jgi:hypothetical protein